ncbi:MAG: NAD(P)-dependent oxidoreductase [Verrucomicrobiae bacterium]|nr:NAD(P)-dependent oxidoreductase [Verrucomicrobiae bacterium]
MNAPSEIETVEQLDELLSRPTPGVEAVLRQLAGDVVVLGVAGKMGLTLARMVRRALAAPHRVYGVARFTRANARLELEQHGIETIACDLLDRASVAQLPDAPYVIYMAGQKFGTSAAPEITWAMNTLAPAHAAERYARSRIVAFSTGCVYPLVSTESCGSREDDELGPPGDYANSCVGRERIFTYFSKKHQTPVALVRLNYAIDLRYGVLLDIALKIWQGEPVDVTMGYVNVIWQRDANAQAIQCLAHATVPPFVLNVTGPEKLSIRALAEKFGQLLDRPVKIRGTEAPTAWLNDSRRAWQLFDPPTASVDDMMRWVAAWIRRGGPTLGKPTHFEVRDGKF